MVASLNILEVEEMTTTIVWYFGEDSHTTSKNYKWLLRVMYRKEQSYGAIQGWVVQSAIKQTQS